MTTKAMIVGTALLLAGCPHWKQTAQELQTSLAAAQSDLAAREARISEQNDEIDRLKKAADEREQSIKTLEAQIADLDKAIADQQEKIANIMKDRGALRGQVDDMKAALAELEARRRAAEASVQAFRDLVTRFQSLIDAGTLNVKIVDGRMVVVLSNDILFSSGSADLSEDGSQTIQTVAGVLATIGDRKFQVEGYTDDAPIRTSRYPSNWYLASARAIHVLERLVEGGLEADRVSAASYGETHPVAANDTPEGKAQNRRIEIVVVPDLSDLPGYDELSKL